MSNRNGLPVHGWAYADSGRLEQAGRTSGTPVSQRGARLPVEAGATLQSSVSQVDRSVSQVEAGATLQSSVSHHTRYGSGGCPEPPRFLTRASRPS